MSPTVSISMLLSITRISSFHKLPLVTLVYRILTMTSLDHWDASLSKHVYCSILSIWIGLVAWYTTHISELLTTLKIVDSTDVSEKKEENGESLPSRMYKR